MPLGAHPQRQRRVVSALTNGSNNYPKWGLSWTYDQYGNRTSQSVTAGSGPSSSLSFNAATNQPTGYQFNASGDLTVEPVGTANNNYSYDAEHHLISVSGGASATYTYDGHGTRVKKAVNGGATTVYIFAGGKDIAEYDNGAAVASPTREYVFSDDMLIATLSGGATTYSHSDNLSARMTTDSNGNVIGQQGHFPFGESWYSANTTTKFLFTSYERDPETGLDYAMARYYDSRVGRFCSADPQGGQVGDPQTWNRYVYSRNDPINLNDPSGQSWWNWVLDIGLGVTAAFLPEIAPALFGEAGAAGTADTFTLASTQVNVTVNGAFQFGTLNTTVTVASTVTSGFSGVGAGIFAGAAAAAGQNKPQSPEDKFRNCNSKYGDANSKAHLNYHGYQEAVQAAKNSNVDQSQVLALWDKESSFNPDLKNIGPSGDTGPSQITPSGVSDLTKWGALPTDWNTSVVGNLTAGARILAARLQKVGLSRAYAAYNAGLRGERLGRGKPQQQAFNKDLSSMNQLTGCMH